MEFTHTPVMLTECIDALRILPNGYYVDMTLGLGGHSEAICRKLTTGRLIAFDKDEAALTSSRKRLSSFGERVTFVHADYRTIRSEIHALGITHVDGILCDMGVSSLQLDDVSRGFSYHADAPLDMRMDRSAHLSATEIVNEWDTESLTRILREYGEERFAARIAAAIIAARPIESTLVLAEVIARAMPAQSRREKQHPARRSFQGIRIAVNDELSGVTEGIQGAIDCLRPGGRCVVLTFHSLEDRPVKKLFQEAARACDCPPDFPVCVCGKQPRLKLVGKQPVVPSAEECEKNPRAHSAKLRVAEKL